MGNATYKERLDETDPTYKSIHATRIQLATRALIDLHPLSYDELLRSDLTWSAARAEFRRRHPEDWRRLLDATPGTIVDVRNGLTLEQLRDGAPWS